PLAPQDARESFHVLAGRAALERASGAGEESEAVRDGRDLVADGHSERLAHVLRLDARQLIAVLLDDRCELEQHLAPLARRAVGPDLVVRLARSLHRAVDVLRRALRHGRDDLTEGRVLDLLHLVACAVDPLAADEHLVASKRGLHMSLLVSALSRAVRRSPPRKGRRSGCPIPRRAARQEWSAASACGSRCGARPNARGSVLSRAPPTARARSPCRPALWSCGCAPAPCRPSRPSRARRRRSHAHSPSCASAPR